MAFIKEFGSWLPPRVVTNAEIAALANCEEEWIRQMSGICERRFASEEETVEEMACAAGRDCLERAGVEASSVGMVIVSCGAPPRRFPGPAAAVAYMLGAGGVPALDVPVASAGALFALSLAGRLAPTYGSVLVIAAERLSPLVIRPPVNRNTAILFGDGAGACLVDASSGVARIADSALHSDGSFAANLRLELDGPIEMNGQSVILQVSRKLPAVIREVLERNGIESPHVDAFLLHQANRNLIDRVARALDVPPEKFFSNIERYGNTSSASMLIAADEWRRRSGFVPGEPVVFAGFGAGLHWGSLLAVGS